MHPGFNLIADRFSSRIKAKIYATIVNKMWWHVSTGKIIVTMVVATFFCPKSSCAAGKIDERTAFPSGNLFE
jgi:hypothetical protein